MTTYFKTLGKYLKTKRAASGVSQATVAKSLGYSSPQFVSNVERGLCMYPLKKIPKLTKVLKLDKVELRELIVAAKVKEIDQALGHPKRG